MNKYLYKRTLERGNKILEKIMPELNKVSHKFIRVDPKLFRRKEDCEEIALALGLYDENIEGLIC